MLFHLGGRAYDLGSIGGFARFPMRATDKVKFVRLMLRTFAKQDWTEWEGRSAAELVDSWAGPGVRTALFERLTRLKFDLPCDQVSGAWLGARLHFREGSAPLGYIPHANWTKVLCDGVTRLLEEAGVRIRTRARVRGLETQSDRVVCAELESGERIEGDLFVSSIPTETYLRLISADETAHLASIRYTHCCRSSAPHGSQSSPMPTGLTSPPSTAQPEPSSCSAHSTRLSAGREIHASTSSLTSLAASILYLQHPMINSQSFISRTSGASSASISLRSGPR
jgi:protoporphyrinogen oxidase